MNKEYLIYKLSDEVKNSCKIDNALFQKYGVKRGLRNEDGSGVLVGLTNIGNVVGYERAEDGHLEPTEGKLFYRGYELDDLVTPIINERRFGFEEIAYLLLSGNLPDKEDLEAFKELINDNIAFIVGFHAGCREVEVVGSRFAANRPNQAIHGLAAPIF